MAKTIIERGLMCMSLVLLLFHGSCTTKKEKTELSVTGPIRKDTLLTRNYVCQIRAIQNVELRALGKGYLHGIFIEEGKPVRKGQTMFQILLLNPKAELQNAEEEVKLAAIEYQYTKQLADSNLLSSHDLALAEANFDKAKEKVTLAQAHRGFIEIKAPFDGIPNYIEAQLGSLVNEGALLTTLSDSSKMWVDFTVPEAEYSNFGMSQKMKVNLLMNNNLPFEQPGTVQVIEPDFDSGDFAFRATFPNPKGLLRDGETAQVQVKAQLRNALIIPQKATFKIQEKKYVFVVTDDNLIHRREIIIAAELPDLCVVKEGLNENEKILLDGIRDVNDRDKMGTYE